MFLLLSSGTEAVLPNGQCSAQDMTCPIDDNFIDNLQDILSAEECEYECYNSDECRIYSYPGTGFAGVPISNSCSRFRDCTVLTPVEGCFTEEIECDGGPGTTATTDTTATTTAAATADTTTATSADTTTPPECEFNGQTLPYPDSCRKYYYCLQDGTTGVFDCCPGVYNPSEEACVPEEEAGELCNDVEDDVCP